MAGGRRGVTFQVNEINDLLDLIQLHLPLSAFSWQTTAMSHAEVYVEEARTADSLKRKFQELCRRNGPSGDPYCPPYIVRAK